MLKEILSITTMTTFLGIAMTSAQEDEVRGVRADFVYEFIPGENFDVSQDIEEAIGYEKKNLNSALSLGIGGEIKVAYTNGFKNLSHVTCFNNIPGVDFYIHEPNTSANRPETIEVLVGLEKNISETPWISLGIKSVKDSEITNYIPFDMDENLESIDISKAYWILIRDAKSRLTTSAYSGFEMSAAIIRAPCNKFIASSFNQFLDSYLEFF